MLAEREALVVEISPFTLHGGAYSDVTVAYPDRSLEHARLGAESVPEELQRGERVLVMRVANMIVSVRRLEA